MASSNTTKRSSTSWLRSGEDEDRLSSLPDVILHDIFSSFDMKYVVQTSLLSTRWRYIWKTLPIMNFDFLSFKSYPNFLKFMDQSLITNQIDKSNLNRKFTLRLLCWDTLPFEQLVLWITAVSNFGNLQEFNLISDTLWSYDPNAPPLNPPADRKPLTNSDLIQLLLSPNYDFYSIEKNEELPACLFSCEELRVLVLNIADGIPDYITLPKEMYLPNLRVLEISKEGICFDKAFTDKLFSACPLLESLTMKNFGSQYRKNNFSICAHSNLKHLVFHFYYEDEELDYTMDCNRFKIYAPNLLSFDFQGSIVIQFLLEDSPSLEKADFDVKVMLYEDELDYDDEHIYSLGEAYRRRIFESLQRVSHVKDLTLSASLLKFVSESAAGIESLPTQFRNLRHLKLVACLSCNIDAIMHMLMISPVIETLILKLDQVDSGNVVNHPYAGLSLEKLKFIVLQHAEGSVNELNFIKVLLEAALVLEKVDIFISKRQALHSDQVIEFRKKILSFSRAPSLRISISSSLEVTEESSRIPPWLRRRRHLCKNPNV